MNGAAMSGARAARLSTGAQPATRTTAVIHNTTRLQVPGTLRIANDNPTANSIAANHTSHPGSAFGNPAALSANNHFAIIPFTRHRIPSTLSPAASRIESDPIAAAGTRT